VTASSPDPVAAAIAAIRVVRRFSDRPLDDAAVERILQAGRHAGSSKNQQRWTFIVVRERARLAELAAVGPWAGHLAGATIAIALVTPDPRAAAAPLSILWDLGRAAQNMVLAAWEAGVGSVPATVYDHDLARRLLGYPADPDDLTRPPKAGGRLALDEVVRQERW